MPSVTIDYPRDPRFRALSLFLEIEVEAVLGRMILVWEFMTDEERHVLSETELIGFGKHERFAEFLCKSELAEKVEGGYRVKGGARTEWLARLRQSGKLGAEKRWGKKRAKKGQQENGVAIAPPMAPPLAPQWGPYSNPIENDGVPISTLMGSLCPKELKNKSSKDTPVGVEGEGNAADAALALVAPPPKVDSKKVGEFLGNVAKCYKAKFGTRPEFLNSGQTLGLAKDILRYRSVEKASQLFETYIQMESEWFKKRHYDFATFHQQLHLVGEALSKGADLSNEKAREQAAFDAQLARRMDEIEKKAGRLRNE